MLGTVTIPDWLATATGYFVTTANTIAESPKTLAEDVIQAPAYLAQKDQELTSTAENWFTQNAVSTAKDIITNNSDTGILPNLQDLETIVIVGVVAIVGLSLFRR